MTMAKEGQFNASFPPNVAPRNALISNGSDDVRPSPEIMVALTVAFASAGSEGVPKLVVVFSSMPALCITRGLLRHWTFRAHMVASLALALSLSLSLSHSLMCLLQPYSVAMLVK